MSNACITFVNLVLSNLIWLHWMCITNAWWQSAVKPGTANNHYIHVKLNNNKKETRQSQYKTHALLPCSYLIKWCSQMMAACSLPTSSRNAWPWLTYWSIFKSQHTAWLQHHVRTESMLVEKVPAGWQSIQPTCLRQFVSFSQARHDELPSDKPGAGPRPFHM